MYSYLSAQSRALVDQQVFTNRYREALNTAHIVSLRSQPLASRQDGSRATFTVRVVLESAIVGEIIREFDVQLIHADNRWGVVWNEGLILPELAGGNRLVMEYRIPARANIYDLNGLALAFQGRSVTLGVVPGRIEDEEGMLEVVAPLLGKLPEEVGALYASALPDWYVPLGDISGDALQENLVDLRPFLQQGLTADERLNRIYPLGSVAPHIVGYVGDISAEEIGHFLSLGYRGDEKVGKAGVEAWGESYLSGVRGGVLSVVDSNGQLQSIIQESQAEQARAIYTTLDRDFQQAIQAALEDAIRTHPLGHAGAIVVLNPQTGAVLAMANFPTYDSVVFDTTRADWQTELSVVLNDTGRPLLNRAVQGQYPPGSTFKIVTLTAGLNSGLFGFDTRFFSSGTWNLLGDNFIKRDWREGGHGNVSYQQALVVSCNTCFYDMAYKLDAVDSFLFPDIAREFGFSRPSGLQGVPAGSESAGAIPDPEWKINNIGEGWVPGDAVNMGIGQGFVLATPLQMANVIAAIANGGTLFQPTIIDRLGAGGNAPEEKWPVREIGQLPLTPDQLAGIQQALRQVASANNGTATDKFATLDIPVAGKTGTAETAGINPHAWFVGYAPAEPITLEDGRQITEPEIAIVVLMENAGEGSAVSAPIFRRVVEIYYGIEPLTPYPW